MGMEQVELRQKAAEGLSAAFVAWNSDNAGSAEDDNLSRAIGFAVSNGIELVLKIPDRVLDENVGKQRLFRGNVTEFVTGIEGDLMLFNVPSSKKYSLVVMDDFRHKEHSSISIKDGNGPFGRFLPKQIAALELK